MKMQRGCDRPKGVSLRRDRNRKRSKRRSIYCPIHGCYLDSVSQKYRIYADKAGQLQQRGMGRQTALLLIGTNNTVLIPNEWLEAFWCPECQKTKWYHICKDNKANTYKVSLAPNVLWQQVTGIANPGGNPSVSEFTQRQSRIPSSKSIKDFKFEN
ncbi:MAG: hypothetical protein AAF378_08120 [Cyanobacteria bacterium P01_A01_bin.84]